MISLIISVDGSVALIIQGKEFSLYVNEAIQGKQLKRELLRIVLLTLPRNIGQIGQGTILRVILVFF